jgi:hypothetical protein
VKPLWRFEDELESRLRASRRKPKGDYVSAIVGRLHEPRRAARRRVALAVALTAVGASIFGAFGGLGYAARAINIAPVTSNSKPATPSKDKPKPDNSKDKSKGNDKNNANSNSPGGPSHDQYKGKTTICHHTGSQSNPWVVITVSDNALPAHERHGDTLVNSSAPFCPGPAIP